MEVRLMRFATPLAAAFVCASLAVHAQDTTVKTKVEGDKSKIVTYTGCLNTGVQTSTFVLDKVVPVTTTRTTGVAGTGGAITTTSTSYVLVPGEKVTLQQHVGKKVQVTGLLIPEGESKTKTKIEGSGGDTKVKTKTDSDKPQFQVMTVKELPEPCM
jgi:hypothetical protein